MAEAPRILVTLSTFGSESPEPLRMLERSGLPFRVNETGKRMRPDEVVAQAASCWGLIAGVEPYDATTLAALGELRCISRCGAGVDAIDLVAAKERGVAVLNTPDPPVAAVAELTLTLILALLRDLPELDRLTHEGAWRRITGRLLEGRRVGVVGLGRIGRRVATLLQAFGAVVSASDPAADGEWARAHGVALTEFSALLPRCEILTLHASGGGQAPRLGAAEFAAMPAGAYLVNTARGDMVDDVALAQALAMGHLAGAALDVFPSEPYDGPLLACRRAILTPHQATLTMETRVAMEVGAVENLLDYLRSTKPR